MKIPEQKVKNIEGLESWNLIDEGFRKQFFKGSYRSAVAFMNKIGRSSKEDFPPDLVIDKDGLWVIFHAEGDAIFPGQREIAMKIDRAYEEIILEQDPPLGQEEIDELKPGLSAWNFSHRALQRIVKIDSFKTAVEFSNRVAAIGIGAGHLPDLVITRESVMIVITSRLSSGVTVSDINLARQVSEVVDKFDQGQGIRNR